MVVQATPSALEEHAGLPRARRQGPAPEGGIGDASIKPEQALHFAQALAKGQPARGKIVKTVLESRIKEMV